MQKQLLLKLLPSESNDASIIKEYIANATGKKKSSITGFHFIKKSIDARRKQTYINLLLNAFIDEPFHERDTKNVTLQDVHNANKKIIIIGAGPAGLFAALKLIESGIKPIILERGKDVRARRRDLARLNKQGIINTESNYCFGEGGAGTYSDGKLYTRSSKRGNVDRILNIFAQFGAADNILYESHPHIGTNKLPAIITSIREQIIACGGMVLFEKKVTGFHVNQNKIKSVITSDGDMLDADAFILATGHSAADIFELLNQNKILIEPKPFALGVRVEHTQQLIDEIQYHSIKRDEDLPPASYNLVQQVNEKGVFSFCMCPGGIIAPAATTENELVVNGWSPSKRNNPFANSGIVVQVNDKDAIGYFQQNITDKKYLKEIISSPLLLMHFQKAIEQKAYNAGGGNFVAPAQRLVDFCNDKLSSSLPPCSYVPGIKENKLSFVLPAFINSRLQSAFKEFGKKMNGYYTNDAVVVATESRTSSPVKIPRNSESLNHPQIINLFPCGEGAGYAGGIVSAAMDGERVASAVAAMI